MKAIFEIDTEKMDEYDVDVFVRTIITMFSTDWREWIAEMYYEFEEHDFINCPECEEKIYSTDSFCRWCGKENKENKS